MNNWKKNVREVVPYTPGEQPQISDIIKLNTNENPYPPSPEVSEVINSFNEDNLRKYPDPNVKGLVKVLADEHGVSEDMVFVGVGSDDVLGMSFLTFFNSDKPILFPDITYSFYDVWAELFRIPYVNPALDDNFKIIKNDYFIPNGGIVIANPNAPTSIEMSLDDIEDIVKSNSDVVVIIDEAYVDFGGTSALALIPDYDNLLVVRTFSKSRSMAGMRRGYAIGQPELIKALNHVKHSYNSYTMSQISIVSGIASVEDKAYFEETTAKIINTREVYKEKIKSLGFSMPDSKTNFLFATHETVPAELIFSKLREKKIYVRYFKKPKIDNYLRITVGTDEEMESLVKALEEIVSSYK
ncbi:MAG: histidinol-phosphate transaminase [Lachnospiraceae bacterium]|nr:histidinol-phosphate transaminase [Lachnospiraceae bacterium]